MYRAEAIFRQILLTESVHPTATRDWAPDGRAVQKQEAAGKVAQIVLRINTLLHLAAKQGEGKREQARVIAHRSGQLL